ncbi:MAG: 50S ribosomal protein L13 [Candidatus Nanoarchaeia archaeon]|nr:50S ribosomal protein L13 [Candidatus Nanoarchaeia archaeon]MDD5741337.1 50S ribosomal protein L13 [Candidatus Nanoarchaeia archaeon]
MIRIIIDATNAIFGRLCSFVAKKAIEGHEIIIVNSEHTVITGNKSDIIEKYLKLRRMGGGSSIKGPKYSNVPYMMLKRGIRGMLPDFRRGQGKIAFSRIKCFNGIPEEYKNEKMVKSGKTKPNKFIELKELSERI